VALQLSFGDILARVRFADFPRADLAGLRALPRVAALPLRAVARFFRRAMTVAFSAECTQFGAPFYIPLRPGRLVLTELIADSPYAAARRYLCSHPLPAADVVLTPYLLMFLRRHPLALGR